MQILLLGMNGQVATKLCSEIKNRNIDFNNFSRKEVDFSDNDSLRNFLSSYSTKIDKSKKNIIINAVAYTNVEKAEEEESLAMQVNAYSQSILAEFAGKNNCTYIHYSTDYVFDGAKSAPYKEEDEPNPINIYGKSKIWGERIIKENTDNFLILRTSWVFSEIGTNFVKKIRELILSRDEINVIEDQIGCPTSAQFIAETTLDLLGVKKEWNDVINLTQPDPISWYGFSNAIKLALNKPKNVIINPVSSKEFLTKAARPKNSVLDTSKLRSILNQDDLRNWKKDLSEVIELINL